MAERITEQERKALKRLWSVPTGCRKFVQLCRAPLDPPVLSLQEAEKRLKRVRKPSRLADTDWVLIVTAILEVINTILEQKEKP